MNNKNKGMYLEKIIDLTIKFHYEDEDFFFIKYHTKNTITKKSKFIYVSNNFVDYFGFVKNRLFVLEAKQNSTNIFNFHRLNDTQMFVLKKLEKMKCWCFIIFYFNVYDEFYILNFKHINSILLTGRKNIKYNEVKMLGKELELRLPGILNLKNILQEIMENKNDK